MGKLQRGASIVGGWGGILAGRIQFTPNYEFMVQYKCEMTVVT